MAPRRCDKPCFVSPHPDVLAKRHHQALLAKNIGNSQISLQGMSHFVKPNVPGLNDGTIFPAEHYTEPTSVLAMSTAALEREPLRGATRVIAVLAEFQDVKMKPGTKERIQDLFFSKGKISTGSVTEYYSEVSNEKISFTGEVIGPVTLSQNMSYYANNDYGMSGTGINGCDMADETFELAKNSVSNWKQYDNDGNGQVDAFIVVHAGRAAEETDNKGDIWSFKWNLRSNKQIDGVGVFSFLTVSEDAKCGVCAHEIGHLVFGWPDLYDTDNSSAGIGSWCLMASGSWGGGGDRPVHPSAWCKASQNWIETVVENENHQITLRDVKTSFEAHRLWTNGDSNSQEYFLIENRQFTGSDGFLPGAGLLVWHIDDNVPTNRDENHPKVKLIEADGLNHLRAYAFRGDAGDPFPGTTNKNVFNATSTPNSMSYAGTDTFVSINNVPASAESMTFDITVKKIDTPPSTDAFNPKVWFRLKNTYNPSSFSLDVINDGGANSKGLIQMSKDGNFSGQHWQIKSNGDGTYSLRSLFLGPTRQLDVYGNDKNTPVLQPKGNVWGQYWVIKGWGDGTWHLENHYGGPNSYLDTMEGGPSVNMNSANIGRPTQRWTITPIRDITEPGFF